MSNKRKNPTVEEIIAYLDKLPKDAEVKLSVKDSYSALGTSATFVDFDINNKILNHAYDIEDNCVILDANLDTQKPITPADVEKFPNITFKKRYRK